MIDQIKKDFFDNLQDSFKKLENESNRSTFLREIAIPIYCYLKNNQQKNGNIFDPYTRSNLDFQYQTPYYILSSILLYNFTHEKKYLSNAEIALEYLNKIGYKINRRVNSFIGISIALSCCFCSSLVLKDELFNYLQGISVLPKLNQKPRNANNFFALKSLCLLLRFKMIGKRKDKQDALNIINNYFVNWQLTDDIFYDQPFELESTDYVPHLAYHATMMMVMAFSGRILSNEKMVESAYNALVPMMALTSPAGEAFGYGRSNHAIFGYANAILGCTLLSDCYLGHSQEINDYRNLLFSYVTKHRHIDGHLYIVPNHLENKRAGLDHYMFVTVYESYALAILLLSHIIQPFCSEIEY